jgi:hypothetical protein
MSNHRDDLLDLHPAAVAAGVLGSRPGQQAAARDAEPETHEPRPGLAGRLLAAIRDRRRPAPRPETNPS